jgi:putative membrane protein
MNRIACLGAVLISLPLTTAINVANARAADTSVTVSAAASKLSPVDYNFVAQANLGAPFQVNSGRVAEDKARSAEIRDYAHLMVTSHLPVVAALNTILKRKGLTAPPNTLLEGAYHAMVSSLKAEGRAALDRDYVEGQLEYQRGNTALFQYEIQYGTDADLKEFARTTLPKIEDHLQRVTKLTHSGKLGKTAKEVGRFAAFIAIRGENPLSRPGKASVSDNQNAVAAVTDQTLPGSDPIHSSHWRLR